MSVPHPSPPSASPMTSEKSPDSEPAAPQFRPRIRAIWSLLMVVACVTVAEVLLKIGANEVSAEARASAVSFGFNAMESPYTVVGILFHIAGFGAWIYTLKSVPLSLAFNFTTVQQVTVPVTAWLLIRGEVMNPMRAAGIVIVVVGVILLVPAIVVVEKKAEEGGGEA